MHVLDNSPISKPAIGRLVTEEQPLWQLADNCLHVLPSNNGIDEKLLAEIFSNLSADGNIHLNKYDYEVLEDLPDFETRQYLKKAIEDEKANMILPLYTPHQAQKQYLVFQSNNETLFSNIGLALYTAERISAYSLREAMSVYAKNNVDDFCEIARSTVDAHAFLKDIVSDATKSIFGPAFYGILPQHGAGFIPDFSETLTFRKKKKLMDRMEDNLRKYGKNKDPQAEAELSAIFKNIDIDILLAILSKMPNKQREMLCYNVNPHKLAEQSSLKLRISVVDPKLRKGNDGVFRLFFEKNNKSEFVHFKRVETFVLYLMYIIDKYKNDNVDTLDVKQHKDQFVKLFNKNYSGMYGEVSYDKLTIVKKEPGKKMSKHPKPLLLCHTDICQTIGSVCEKLQESALPYIIKTPQDHISVLKSNIIIPQEILDLVK